MIKKSHLLIAICLATLAGILLGACAPKKPAEEVTLRLALLPILDALPIHVAQKEGYFADEGVKVELGSKISDMLLNPSVNGFA